MPRFPRLRRPSAVRDPRDGPQTNHETGGPAQARGLAGRWLGQLLHTHDTPRRTAAAYGLGVFFGFSPFLGLHTVLGLIAAFILNLNRVAVILGIYSNLPWILPAYYTVATVAGAAILRVEVPPGLVKELTEVLTDFSWTDFRLLAHALKPLIGAYFLGSTLGALVLAAAAYRISLAMIVTHRRRLAHRAEQTEE